MKTLIDQSDLVAGSDYISLSRTMVPKQRHLVDKITDNHLRLNDDTAQLLNLLDIPIPIELWLKYAKSLNIKEDSLLNLLVSLNELGALEIKRNIYGHSTVFYKHIKRIIFGLTPTLHARRRKINFINICKAVLVAMEPLVIAVLFLAVLAYGINIRTNLIVLSVFSFLLFIALSTTIHEWIHSLIIANNKSPQILVQRGLRIGILYGKLPRALELQSAITGPLVGALVSLNGGLILGIAIDKFYFVTIIGMLVAGMQLISLLPAYGDGRVVWDNIRRIAKDA